MTHLSKPIMVCFSICLAFGLNYANADQVDIDFDGTGAPDIFAKTVALTDLYSPLGVTFAGLVPQDGGGILNQGGGFGVNARSGTDFLAFNRDLFGVYLDGGTPTDPGFLFFDLLVTDVSIWASGGGSTTFRMDGFKNDQLIMSDNIQSLPGDWAQLSISSNTGFDTVILTETGGDNAFVYDDLSFTTIPEPSFASLLTICLVAGWMRRRS